MPKITPVSTKRKAERLLERAERKQGKLATGQRVTPSSERNETTKKIISLEEFLADAAKRKAERPLERRVRKQRKLDQEVTPSSENQETAEKTQDISQEIGFASLSNEIVSQIATLLPLRDLMHFEEVCKNNQSCTEKAWKIQRERAENHLDFEFALCEGMCAKDKYLFGNAVLKYILVVCGKKEGELIYVHEGRYVKETFAFIMERFPALKIFILQDLNKRMGIKSNFKNKELYQSIFDHALAGFGGEALLQAWITHKVYNVPGIALTLGLVANVQQQKGISYGFIDQAVRQKATCASLVAARIPGLVHPENLIDLACYAADQGDFRALELLMERNPDATEDCYPPVLAQQAHLLYKSNKIAEADPLYEKAILGYGTQAPSSVLVQAALTKDILKQYDQAANLYKKGIEKAYQEGRLVHYTILKCAIKAEVRLGDMSKSKKEQLMHYAQAKIYCEKALALKNHPATTMRELCQGDSEGLLLERNREMHSISQPTAKDFVDIMRYKGHAEVKLLNYIEADATFEEAFTIAKQHGIQLSIYALVPAAFTKLELKQWKEADELYKEILRSPSQNLNFSHIYYNAAVVKEQLGDLDLAMTFLEKCIKSFGNKVPKMCRNMLAFLKKKQQEERYY